jgi:hypothetical protein
MYSNFSFILGEVEEIFAVITNENGKSEKKKLEKRDYENERYWTISFTADPHISVQLEVHYQNGYVELMETDLLDMYE